MKEALPAFGWSPPVKVWVTETGNSVCSARSLGARLADGVGGGLLRVFLVLVGLLTSWRRGRSSRW